MKLPALPPSRVRRAAVFLSLLLVLTLQLVHIAHVYSLTWDEAHHLFDGYTIWTKHDYRLNPEVPPLLKLTAALPLLGRNLYAPPNQGRSEPMEAFLDGRDFVTRNGIDRVVFPARMAVMLFPLLLACLIFLAARRMFGTLAAYLALTLFIFDPNVLANGTLITTDLGSACLLFAAIYAFYRYSVSPTWPRLALAGLAAGLAVIVKFTGILLAPMLVLLAIAEALRARSLTILAKRLAACAAIALCAWAIIWAAYGFRAAPAPNGLQLSPTLLPYIQSMPNPSDAAHLTAVAHLHLLPEPYLWGLANTKKTEFEYTAYFFGKIYRHGPWQYFPAAFLIKSTLPLLLLLALSPFLLSLKLANGKRTTRTRELTFLLIPVLVYFTVITTSHFDIGARHMLPIYPFLYILVAAAAAHASRARTLWAAVTAIAVLWQAVGTLTLAPNYMNFGNEAWGGPTQVHRYLSDANVDWGQQLKAVKHYLDAHHITHCWFVYFPDGAIEPRDYGVPCNRLPAGSDLFWLNLPMDVPPVIDGPVLISESDLVGVELGDGPLNPYNSFLALTPTAVIQGGVNVYQGRFAVPLASALVDVRRTGELVAQGQPEAALTLAGIAVTLAPDSAITQLNLADRLAAASRWPEALDHYQQADHLIRTIHPDLQEDDLLPRATAGITTASQHL